MYFLPGDITCMRPGRTFEKAFTPSSLIRESLPQLPGCRPVHAGWERCRHPPAFPAVFRDRTQTAKIKERSSRLQFDKKTGIALFVYPPDTPDPSPDIRKSPYPYHRHEPVGKPRSQKPPPARCRPVGGHSPRFPFQMRTNTITGMHEIGISMAIHGQNGKIEK